MQNTLVPVLRGRAEPGEPLGAAAQDGRRHGDGLDVVDRGRATPNPGHGGERRLHAGLALGPFETFNQRRLLAADIGAGAAVNVDVVVEAGTAGIGAEKPGVVGLGDGRLEAVGLQVELAANVDIGRPRGHGGARQQAAFDQLVRVVAHDFPVLAGAGLAFVGVDHQITGQRPRLLGHERPFQPRREAGAAAAAKAGFLHLLDDPVAALGDDLPGAVPVATVPGAGQAPVMETVEIGEDAVVIAQHHAPSLLWLSWRVVRPAAGSDERRPVCEPGVGVSPRFSASITRLALAASRSS